MSSQFNELRRFTIRVYAIIFSGDQILLSREKIGDLELTKFPGGGLEPGETPLQCLSRELKEECDCEPSTLKLVHVTDKVISSMFENDTQVIGIYYSGNTHNTKAFPQTIQPFMHHANHMQCFWTPSVEVLKHLTLETDRLAFNAFIAEKHQAT